MRVSCSHPKLREIVSAAARVAATARGIQYVLIEANQDGVAVTGEGSAHRVKSLIDAEVRVPGTVCLPARSFEGLLSSISGDKVTLSLASPASVDLRCGDHRTALRTIDVRDVAEWPSREFADVASVLGSELRGSIQRTAFIATDEDTVTLLSGGVLLDDHNSLLRLTGMDRTRLSVSTLPSALYSAPFVPVVVPARTLIEVERLDIGSEAVTVARSDTEIRFACGTWEVRSRTIAGPIPEFDSRIPLTFAIKALISRSELLEALSVAAILSVDEPRSVQLAMDARKNRCVVTTRGSQLGRQHSEIVATIVGEDTTAEVSVRLLIDGVRISSQAVVQLGITEPPLQRCLVKTSERDDDVYVFAVVR